MTIEFVFPQGATTDTELGLVELTRQLRLKTGESGGFGLGGRDGYGIDYENDVFMMHHFCWCESEDCKWCGEEEAPNFVYKPTGASIHWYQYIGRSQKQVGELPSNWLQVCVRSIWELSDCWYEYEKGSSPRGMNDIINGRDDASKITLCFNVGDPDATVTLYPTEMSENSIQFWDLDTIICDCLTFGDPEENEKLEAKLDALSAKYPALKEKIKIDAIAAHKGQIEWHERWLRDELV